MGTVVSNAPGPILSNPPSMPSPRMPGEIHRITILSQIKFLGPSCPAPPHCSPFGFPLAPYPTKSRSASLSNESRTKATDDTSRTSSHDHAILFDPRSQSPASHFIRSRPIAPVISLHRSCTVLCISSILASYPVYQCNFTLSRIKITASVPAVLWAHDTARTLPRENIDIVCRVNPIYIIGVYLGYYTS